VAAYSAENEKCLCNVMNIVLTLGGYFLNYGVILHQGFSIYKKSSHRKKYKIYQVLKCYNLFTVVYYHE